MISNVSEIWDLIILIGDVKSMVHKIEDDIRQIKVDMAEVATKMVKFVNIKTRD